MNTIDEDKMREVLANQRKCYLVDVINENIYGLAMANTMGTEKGKNYFVFMLGKRL